MNCLKSFLVGALIFFSVSCIWAKGGQESSPELTVFIAASTTDVISVIAASYEKDTGVVIKINPASSGTLAKQIEQGAPADVYISASAKWMKYIKELGVSEMESSFIMNRLVLIAPEDTALNEMEISENLNLPELFKGHFSMGDPAHVPAGKYAKEALEYYGWYETLGPQILPAADVRAALSVVELDEADLGVVYETDALKSGHVKVVSHFPEESHTPIEYFCSVLKESAPEAEAFYNYLLNSTEAKELYTKYGFSLPE